MVIRATSPLKMYQTMILNHHGKMSPFLTLNISFMIGFGIGNVNGKLDVFESFNQRNSNLMDFEKKEDASNSAAQYNDVNHH